MERLKTILLIFLIIIGLTQPLMAKEKGKFILILLDQLSLPEVNLYGGSILRDLFEKSAQALINVRTDGGIEPEYIYQAIGAGSRGESYGGVYGTLGQVLKDNNLKPAVYGNSDFGTEERRDVITIVMDKEGNFPCGNVSRFILKEDSSFPGGWRTDYTKMASLFVDGYSNCDLVVLEVGDIGRIKYAMKNYGLDKQSATIYIFNTLKRVDRLLKTVLNTVDLHKDRLVIIAPTPDLTGQFSNSRLSWAMMIKREGKGLLSTPTTRRAGLITISDIAPTILNFFNLKIPSEMMGRPLYIINEGGGLKEILTLQNKIQRTSDLRPLFIKGFILIQIVILALATITFLMRKWIKGIWWKIITTSILSLQLIPTLFLIFSPYLIKNFYLYLISFLVILALITWLIKYFVKSPFHQVTFIALLTSLLLVIDIYRKTPWMSSSLLGYCPVIGARFYGIGNEFMGILIGGTLIGWPGLLDIYQKLNKNKLYLTPMVFLFITFMIGYPALGANFGGTLTALSAFGFSYFLMFEREKRSKILVLILLFIFLFVGILIIGDTFGLAGERSHLGQTIHLLKAKGLEAIFNIITRKLSMNLKLLRWTIWTRVLLTFIIVLFLLFKRPRGYLHYLTQTFPNFKVGFLGIILGSVVTMFVNDSGVVAAATLLFFAVHSLIYLFLKTAEAN